MVATRKWRMGIVRGRFIYRNRDEHYDDEDMEDGEEAVRSEERGEHGDGDDNEVGSGMTYSAVDVNAGNAEDKLHICNYHHILERNYRSITQATWGDEATRPHEEALVINHMILHDVTS